MTRTTMYSLKDELETEIKDNARELYEDRYPEDRLHEMADSSVPVYNGDRIECLEDDPSIAYMDDPGLCADDADIFTRLGVAIYEQLSQHAHSTWSDLKDEIDEALNDIDELDGEDLDDDSSVTLADLNVHHGDLFDDEDLELLTAASHTSDPDWQEKHADDIDDARDRAVEAYRAYRREGYWEEIDE